MGKVNSLVFVVKGNSLSPWVRGKGVVVKSLGVVVKVNSLSLCVPGVYVETSRRARAQKYRRPCTPPHPTRAPIRARTPTHARMREEKRETKRTGHALIHTRKDLRARTHAHPHARTYAHTWACVYLYAITFPFCSFRKCYSDACWLQKNSIERVPGMQQLAILPLF